MPYYEPDAPHTHETHEVREPDAGGSITGFAAIKYAAIVIIVLAILAFLAWYVLPMFGG